MTHCRIPIEPAFADGFSFDLLNATNVAFRSANRIVFYKDRIYRDIGIALESGFRTSQLLRDLIGTYGAAKTFKALHRLATLGVLEPKRRTVLVREHLLSGSRKPFFFGDTNAPFRTCLLFEVIRSPPGNTFGYYVFGRGTRLEAASTGCIAEAAERNGTSAPRKAAILELDPKTERESAIAPSELLTPSESGANETVKYWTPAISLVSGRIRYLPSTFCYFGLHGRFTSKIRADSTGCAAGTTIQSAALSGFFELVERDSFRRWWLGKFVGRSVRIESFDNGFIADMRNYLAALGRSLHLFDITTILGVSVFVALSFDGLGRGALGVSANFDAQSAIRGAILELGLALNWTKIVLVGERALTLAMRYGPGAPVDLKRYLTAEDYPTVGRIDAATALNRAADLMREHGNELLLLDTTQPGASFSTVRMTIPGLFRCDPGITYQLVEGGFDRDT